MKSTKELESYTDYLTQKELADLLDHASLETTRIYTVTTAEERRQKMNRLDL